MAYMHLLSRPHLATHLTILFARMTHLLRARRPPRSPSPARPILWLCAAVLLPALSHAQTLPAEFDAALARAKIPRDAVSVLFTEAGQDAKAAPRLSWRSNVPMNPASVMKLVTTFAALDTLGPAYTWSTPVYIDGTLHDATLHGNVYIQGQGDPNLVLERLWLLLRRLQGLGVQSIAGDIVLDHSAWDVPAIDPGNFDGEPLKPYNATPDALLINFKSVVMTFTPQRGGKFAQVQFDPPLFGVQMQSTVPLSNADCGDYRAGLKANFADPEQIRFAGSYPSSCGEKVWPVAYAQPSSYALRAVQGMWLQMGGKITGTVRYGVVPAAVVKAKPAFEASSLPLAEVLRDINKYSNNVMAQQLFLTLGQLSATAGGTGTGAASANIGGSVNANVNANVKASTALTAGTTAQTVGDDAPPLAAGSFTASRAAVQQWWRSRIDDSEVPVLDNGSGLSRRERISAQALGRLLQAAYRSPYMSEFMSSLPISGVDGTLQRAKGHVVGSAHLKTGTLGNAIARAGFVDAANGKRYILVALINHPNAPAAREAMQALVEWAISER